MKKAILTNIFLFISLVSSAVAIKFEAKTSHKTVQVGQQFQVTFTVNARAGNYTPPSLPNLQILRGPSYTQGSSNINGAVSENTSISYILRATKVGNIQIGAAKIKIGNKTYQTNKLNIKVVAQGQQGKTKEETIEDYVFIKALVNKRSAYVGENVTVTFKVYSRLPIKQFLGLETNPSLTGFYQQEIGDRKNLTVEKENVNGVVYETLEIQKLLLFPQRSGKLKIDPMEVKLGVQVQNRRARTAMEQFFGSYQLKEVTAKSRIVSIDIKNLPTIGKPANFTGAVGKFNMKMTANKDSVESNEAIDIKVVINGTGNIPLINSPKLNFPNDFEVYDPETKNNFTSTSAGANGSKSFNYLVIPRHAGDFNLKPYQFSYFDPSSKQYKIIAAKPITIAVKKGENEENVVYKGADKEDVELLNTDIRYIHLNGASLFKVNELFYGSPLFYTFLILLLLIGLGLFFYSKKYKAIKANKVGLRKSKAKKLAKKRLTTAKKHLDANELRTFYEEISTSLYGYFADKFNISVADLSQEKIIELLPTDDLKVEVKTTLEEAEMARFAPDSSVNPTILYEKSADIILKTENALAK